MSTDESTAKEKIFLAAMELVAEGKTEQQITTREIASKAGVNLALVNYYYRSKENLLSEVVGTMMGDIIEQSGQNNRLDSDPETRLKNMLLETADTAFKYHNICKIAISLELKSGCGNSCKMVIPLLREIFTDCDESELNIIALQLMIPFHHIVLKPELYGRYLNTDFFDEKKRKQTINQMVDCILFKRIKEEK
ncbi:MAG: putative DNA-binding transcriptional regulator [Firmicutes bacterium ADurb.Bin182]|nr:MAG: putative DNA-binding transcriptional regulator [Firmicutes bacterium ADurb.Bin182]